MIKKLFKKKTKQKELPTRITNDTVAEHRERVLAGGRKLKYPVQYTRSALVRNAIIISLAALVALVLAIWMQLYIFKDTSDIAYRITNFTRLPVAKIGDEFVPYSDYLLYYRASLTHIDNQNRSGSDAPQDKIAFQSEMAMEKALRESYARGLAKQYSISVSDERIDELIRQAREKSGLSEKAYAAATWDNLRWTMDEMRLALGNDLIRQEVAFRIDEEAAAVARQVEQITAGGATLTEVADQLGEKVEYVQGVVVPVGNADGGLSSEVGQLEVGEISAPIKTSATDGYYIALRQESAEGSVAYSYIKVPLTVFEQEFKKLRDSDQTRLFINIKEEES